MQMGVLHLAVFSWNSKKKPLVLPIFRTNFCRSLNGNSTMATVYKESIRFSFYNVFEKKVKMIKAPEVKFVPLSTLLEYFEWKDIKDTMENGGGGGRGKRKRSRWKQARNRINTKERYLEGEICVITFTSGGLSETMGSTKIAQFVRCHCVAGAVFRERRFVAHFLYFW